MAIARDANERTTLLGRAVGFFVTVFERFLPDPFLFAVLLTIVTAVLALIFGLDRSFSHLLRDWVGGLFSLLEFALQMILILVTGYALANSRAVKAGLERIAALPRSPRSAVMITLAVSTVASWLQWGFGLVVAALLAREIAKRIRMDFGWLVAAAYTGFAVWASGPSSSIALALATGGSKVNYPQQVTGQIIPLAQSIFTPFNLVPVLIILVAMPLIYAAMEPAPSITVAADPEHLKQEDEATPPVQPRTFASVLENAWVLNVVLFLAGALFLVQFWSTNGFHLDINTVILIFLILGLLLHWRPIAYAAAVNSAARVTGPLILQYPFYGGIMGIMSGTGLAVVMAKWFIGFSTAATLPFWSYVASIIISFFVPSGGGHWAIQGPFVVPAAAQLHASQAGTAMGVAMGEQVANMIQPFWALPIIAIAGIGIRRVMGFTVVSFFVTFVIYGLSLLLLVPR